MNIRGRPEWGQDAPGQQARATSCPPPSWLSCKCVGPWEAPTPGGEIQGGRWDLAIHNGK